jgi:hypothetical protein
MYEAITSDGAAYTTRTRRSHPFTFIVSYGRSEVAVRPFARSSTKQSVILGARKFLKHGRGEGAPMHVRAPRLALRPVTTRGRAVVGAAAYAA